jgi:fructokinase
MIKIGSIEAGGTKMVLAVGNGRGEIETREEIATVAPSDCVPQMIEWFRGKGIDALGIGSFGPTCVDPHNDKFGKILETPKLAWKHFDFRGAFTEALGIPVGYDTDVNAACLGESLYGAAKGCDQIIYVTVGTGIGVGVMAGGHLLHGMLHPEAGHILVKPVAGDVGRSVCPYHQNCLEGLASGPSIEKRWEKSAKELSQQPKVWELESAYLAEGIANYILCYSPKKIILGGGVMKQQQLFPLIRSKTLDLLGNYIAMPELQDMDSYIVSSGCEGNQGILGAMELGRRSLDGALLKR